MEIPKLTSWVPFKPSLCGSCIATCCQGWPVEASVRDLVRLGRVTEEEAAGSLPAAVRRLKKEGIVRSYRPRSFVFVLEQKKNGDCIFLDEKRRCSVYENRPEICRRFPKQGPRPNHCPYLPK